MTLNTFTHPSLRGSSTIIFLLVTSLYGAVHARVISAGHSQSDYTTVFATLKPLLTDESFGGQDNPEVFLLPMMHWQKTKPCTLYGTKL
jgi:hypothetical protein